ncbi:spermidine/putrescine ABC transporter membrane protein [Klebsiella pneumoniae]|uniref:Spermidine/putrescine transport system permease protein PotC n=1 Tax=Klebsiella pneumoniae TaxID=573 RepID=A0A3S4I0Z0_KLEPN|nr:spermidine/putrescine ABC transporter membrane protein [Klebsiella pneumoniae]
MIGRLLRGGFMTAIYAYLYIPIIILIVNSFNRSRFGINWQGFTTDWYSLLMNNDSLLQAAQHSLTMAVLSATFATLIGSLTAVALYRYRFRGKPFVSGMLFVVMMSPDIVMAISLLVLFMLIGVQLGFWSLLFSHITFCLPFVVVTVYSRLKGFDVRMLEAAKDLGASEMTILRKIILPLALPAVAAGWLLSFTLSMDDVVVSSFVTGPGYEILPLKIYSMVKVGVSPEVNALATILLVLSLVMVIASQLIARDKNSGDVKMKKWSRHLLAAGALAIGMGAAHADDSKTLYFYNLDRVCAAGPAGAVHQRDRHQGYLFDLRVERNHVRQAQNL